MLHPCLNVFHLFLETVVQIQCHDDDGLKDSHFKITLKRLRRQGRRGSSGQPLGLKD
jgi:hypothetical protein